MGTRIITDRGNGVMALTIPVTLDVEPFPREAGVELIIELVTESNGYQYLEVHPDPEDLSGEPAHERAVSR